MSFHIVYNHDMQSVINVKKEPVEMRKVTYVSKISLIDETYHNIKTNKHWHPFI